jgi:hypothetical protein
MSFYLFVSSGTLSPVLHARDRSANMTSEITRHFDKSSPHRWYNTVCWRLLFFKKRRMLLR